MNKKSAGAAKRMDLLSEDMNQLKQLSKKMNPHYYAGIQSAWMGLCLLNDARLTPKLDTEESADVFRQSKSTDLQHSLHQMESACANNPDILRVIERIRRFMTDHPELFGNSGKR